MAKHISFGTPVNDAERWAFSLLADELPQDYLLLTNVEIPTKSGQAMEVDALVVGQWGVYVVDVKGYIGRLNAGMHAWSLDGRDVDNSLSKANYVARVLAGKLKHKIPVGVYAPWCQGMVFVTGRKGEEIELEKDDGALSIYTPRQIIAALTGEWALTAPKAHQVTERQREMVLDTIGQVAVVESRNNRIQDFIKLKCLFLQNGLEIWQAEYNPGGWSAPWLLKILLPVQFDDAAEAERHEQQLREEFQRLQALSGCCGVPYCAPLIQDGEQLVLPIRMPRGVPLNVLETDELTTYQLLEILRRSVTGLQQIQRRGYTVGGWAENCVFISDGADVEYIDIRNNVTVDEDIQAYAERFCALAEQTGQPRIYQWYQLAARGGTVDLDALRCDLSALIELGICDPQTSTVTIETGAVLDNHYRLTRFIAATPDSQLWQGQHLQGRYPVGVGIYHQVDNSWPRLSALYRSLSKVFHPNIEKVLAFGQLSDGDSLFIVRAWEDGDALDVVSEFSPAQLASWFTQLLNALYYLHQLDIFHGAICPKNIVCSPKRAYLVNFGVGLDIAAAHYASQYADPLIWQEESDELKDLYGLVASFIDVLTPAHISGDKNPEAMAAALAAFDPAWLGETLYQTCAKVLNFEFQPEAGVPYSEQFGLDSSDGTNEINHLGSNAT
ncbi:serine/threonine protein kinase [Shewanella sp. NFH-SH190041]|uniref:NERD domain-containing protein kinase family protein n=1 Tax=Shewanella sp. NFH-SH190041 TaxID=2950245 RepID=UPI0021C38F2A|nr:NERD domain-containing protein kinase family protein [Shewanella sp. NFH-SH190041]BDM64999.1 serine/threonine protein kinase [Shewanella sp. NFH-SH190041]